MLRHILARDPRCSVSASSYSPEKHGPILRSVDVDGALVRSGEGDGPGSVRAYADAMRAAHAPTTRSPAALPPAPSPPTPKPETDEQAIARHGGPSLDNDDEIHRLRALADPGTAAPPPPPPTDWRQPYRDARRDADEQAEREAIERHMHDD